MFHAFRVVGEGARRAGGRFRGFRFAAFVFGVVENVGPKGQQFFSGPVKCDSRSRVDARRQFSQEV